MRYDCTDIKCIYAPAITNICHIAWANGIYPSACEKGELKNMSRLNISDFRHLLTHGGSCIIIEGTTGNQHHLSLKNPMPHIYT